MYTVKIRFGAPGANLLLVAQRIRGGRLFERGATTRNRVPMMEQESTLCIVRVYNADYKCHLNGYKALYKTR